MATTPTVTSTIIATTMTLIVLVIIMIMMIVTTVVIIAFRGNAHTHDSDDCKIHGMSAHINNSDDGNIHGSSNAKMNPAGGGTGQFEIESRSSSSSLFSSCRVSVEHVLQSLVVDASCYVLADALDGLTWSAQL